MDGFLLLATEITRLFVSFVQKINKFDTALCVNTGSRLFADGKVFSI